MSKKGKSVANEPHGTKFFLRSR